MSAGLVTNAAAMAAVVMLMVSLFTPFVEAIPLFADTPANKGLHDGALRLVNVLLNVAVVFLFAAASSGVSAADVMPLLVQALAQAAGAHFAYQVVTSGGSSAVTAAPDPASAVPATTDSTDRPPGVPLETLTAQLSA